MERFLTDKEIIILMLLEIVCVWIVDIWILIIVDGV
jgi:hypothetical protein